MPGKRDDRTKPYVICHIFMSIDGRISGPFMFDPAAAASREAYARMQGAIGADAIAYGSTTTKGFVGGSLPRLRGGAHVKEGDFVAPHQERSYYLSIDPLGEIAWQSGTFRRAGRPDAHAVELITQQTSHAYRAYLQQHGVSYIVAGHDSVDFARAVHRAGELFGIRRVLVCGGGVTDMAVLASSALDELSLVVAPVASGESDVATLFDESPFASGGSFPFSLASVEQIEGDGLHIVYQAKR